VQEFQGVFTIAIQNIKDSELFDLHCKVLDVVGGGTKADSRQKATVTQESRSRQRQTVTESHCDSSITV
jgi:hypothetical protein